MATRLISRIKRAAALSAVLALAALSGHVHAAYQAYMFNVDMTPLTPAPTYSQVVLSYTLPTTTFVSCALYDDFNLTGYFNGCAGHNVSYTYSNPEMLDGIFSISFGFDDAVSLLAPFTIVGINADGQRTTQLIVMDINHVPEPASLVLVGLSLLGFGLSRLRSTQG